MHTRLLISAALFIMSIVSSGGVTAASATGQAAPKPVEVTAMILPSELTDAEIASFEKDNPDIRVKRVEISERMIDLAIASRDLPDLLRIGSSQLPPLVRDRLLLDITDYMGQGKRIAFDDLAKATKNYEFNGRYYGLPKDWSLDFSLFINTKAFKDAGLPIPSATEPMTYAELAEMSIRLTQRKGQTVTRPAFFTYALEAVMRTILMQQGKSLFSSDFTQIQITNNPAALDVVRYFYDLAIDGRMALTPESPDGIDEFLDGRLPIIQFGYWMGATVTPDKAVYGQVMMLPGPTWNRRLPRINMTVGPVGIVISAKTKHPREAFRLLEWYVAGKGGEGRARTGLGVPTLLSMQSLMPQKTPLDRQRLDVLKSELPYANWRLDPYPYRSIVTAFNQSWVANLKLAKTGKIDFAKFASNLQEEVNLAIINERNSLGREQ